jgi:hypothetical protein
LHEKTSENFALLLFWNIYIFNNKLTIGHFADELDKCSVSAFFYFGGERRSGLDVVMHVRIFEEF